MKFDELDVQMRVFETAHDHCALPGIYLVARIDGRSFTRLTKDVHKFEAPFDPKFRDLMLDTTEGLLTEFNAVYGFTQSDEISLLFPLSCDLFGRKLRKLNSVLAGYASAKFSLGLGSMACFDCRICQLPREKHVVDYFRWRNEDAHRNALSAHCYWNLRKRGETADAASKALLGLSVADKNEMLFQQGVNFNELPAWQKRGMGLYWEDYEKEGVNQKTGEKVSATRRRIKRDMELPMKEAYSEFVGRFVGEKGMP
ncbi:MAG TPA: tRNA(His) guanylyltransferase Thg1 family protein [Tepidisphaeraceae bacterium]|nr:tRNA(His) guanylyltransferase Thg1 family protein [Tepidisphaeraceae bacterium]